MKMFVVDCSANVRVNGAPNRTTAIIIMIISVSTRTQYVRTYQRCSTSFHISTERQPITQHKTSNGLTCRQNVLQKMRILSICYVISIAYVISQRRYFWQQQQQQWRLHSGSQWAVCSCCCFCCCCCSAIDGAAVMAPQWPSICLSWIVIASIGRNLSVSARQ